MFLCVWAKCSLLIFYAHKIIINICLFVLKEYKKKKTGLSAPEYAAAEREKVGDEIITDDAMNMVFGRFFLRLYFEFTARLETVKYRTSS